MSMSDTDWTLHFLMEIRLDVEQDNTVNRERLVRMLTKAYEKIESMEYDKELLLKILNKQIRKRRNDKHVRRGVRELEEKPEVEKES